MTNDERPLLIIVGGAPASGKSTLAEWLAAEFSLPLIFRDGIKEPLMDALGVANIQESERLGAAAFHVMLTVARAVLASGIGVVLESNFKRGLSEVDLKVLAEDTRAIGIYCEATDEEIRRHYIERAKSGTRHPGHFDSDPRRTENLMKSLDRSLYEPLDLDIPSLIVNTTDDYNPDREAIATFIRRAAGET